MVTNPCFATDGLMLVLAAAAAEAEACGLLVGEVDAIRPVPARNVSAHPRDSFEIDPAALLAAHRAARAGGAALLGCWHTHPSGDPAPSRRDAADAAADGRLWLIATAREARLWRAVPTGAVHGRFDPVRFDVTAGSHVEKAVLAVQHRGAGRGIVVLPGGGSVI